MIDSIYIIRQGFYEYYLIKIKNIEYICDRFNHEIINNKYKVVILYDCVLTKNVIRQDNKQIITLEKLFETFNVKYDLYFKDSTSGEIVYKLNYNKYVRMMKISKII